MLTFISKYFIYLLLLPVLIIGSYFIFSPKKVPVQAAERNTEVKINRKIVDAGKTDRHKPIQASFELTNIGLYPLVISDVKTDCHCTASTWDKEPILPRKSTRVILTYDSHSPGFFQKTAVIYCNTKSPLLLVFRGEVNF